MKSSRRRKGSSSTRRFFSTLIVLIAGSWMTYHVFSYFVLKSELPRGAAAAVVAPDEQTIVSRVKLDEVVSLDLKGVKPESNMILLAGTNRAPVTQAAVQTVQPEGMADKVLTRANQLVNDGKTIDARNLLNEYLADHFEDSASQPIRDRAVELGEQTLLSLKVYPGDTLASYDTIRRGDLLARVAKKCDVPYQFLCRINQISDPGRVRVGQKIKLVKGPVTLKVVKHELMMYVFLQDVLFAKYQVGLGKNDKTPVGKWLVVDCVRKPSYVDPDTGRSYGPNDPENPIGGYWVRLKGIEGETVGKNGFGIHGTIEPDSIGKFESKGCVRMRNEEVGEVFDMLISGKTEVYTLP